MIFSIAAIIYVGGGLVSEGVGGWYSYMYGEENFIYSIIVTIEEIFELTGIVLLIYGLLDYISNYRSQISFSIQKS